MLSLATGCLLLKVMGTHSEATWYSNPTHTWMRMLYLLLGVMLNLDCRKIMLTVFFFAWALILALFRFPFVGMELPVCLILLGLVYGAISGKVVLKNRFLAFSGKICFGLYVLHFFVRAVFDNIGWDYSTITTVLKAAVLLVYMGSSYLLAVASFYFFEMPIQRLRVRFEGS